MSLSVVSGELGRCVVAWRRHTHRSLISEKTCECDATDSISDLAQITLKLIACKNRQGKSQHTGCIM